MFFCYVNVRMKAGCQWSQQGGLSVENFQFLQPLAPSPHFLKLSERRQGLEIEFNCQWPII